MMLYKRNTMYEFLLYAYDVYPTYLYNLVKKLGCIHSPVSSIRKRNIFCRTLRKFVSSYSRYVRYSEKASRVKCLAANNSPRCFLAFRLYQLIPRTSTCTCIKMTAI